MYVLKFCLESKVNLPNQYQKVKNSINEIFNVFEALGNSLLIFICSDVVNAFREIIHVCLINYILKRCKVGFLDKSAGF